MSSAYLSGLLFVSMDASNIHVTKLLPNLTVEVVQTISIFGLSDISMVTLSGTIHVLASVEMIEDGNTIDSVKVSENVLFYHLKVYNFDVLERIFR